MRFWFRMSRPVDTPNDFEVGTGEAVLDTRLPLQSRGVRLPAGEGCQVEARRPCVRPYSLRLRYGNRRYALSAGSPCHSSGARVWWVHRGLGEFPCPGSKALQGLGFYRWLASAVLELLVRVLPQVWTQTARHFDCPVCLLQLLQRNSFKQIWMDFWAHAHLVIRAIAAQAVRGRLTV